MAIGRTAAFDAFLDYDVQARRHRLWLRRQDDAGISSLRIEMVFEPETGEPTPPALSLPPEDMRAFLQVIVNEAEKIGIVTRGGEHSNLRDHLDDMRKIAFKQLGIAP